MENQKWSFERLCCGIQNPSIRHDLHIHFVANAIRNVHIKKGGKNNPKECIKNPKWKSFKTALKYHTIGRGGWEEWRSDVKLEHVELPSTGRTEQEEE